MLTFVFELYNSLLLVPGARWPRPGMQLAYEITKYCRLKAMLERIS